MSSASFALRQRPDRPTKPNGNKKRMGCATPPPRPKPETSSRFRAGLSRREMGRESGEPLRSVEIVDFLIGLGGALRTIAMGKQGIRTVTEVIFDLLPIPRVAPDLLAH